MAIKIDGFSDAIMNELQIYTKDVVEKISEAGESVAKAGADKLKQTSPKKTGSYAKGWTVNKQEEYGKPTQYTIHNKKHYRLTHLLENGHAKRGGGRTKAIVHIKPVEEEVVEQYIKGVEEAIENAGH